MGLFSGMLDKSIANFYGFNALLLESYMLQEVDCRIKQGDAVE